MPAPILLWVYWHGAVLDTWSVRLLYWLCSALPFAVYTGYLMNGISLLLWDVSPIVADWLADTSGSVLAILLLYKLNNRYFNERLKVKG